ncbi:hypothetical protein DMB95_08705 [Campylobacter sp. MIT 12-8780]|uniref:hypothetical protein n=1 Tax=unclassified Campylobacter TaxID=2593542 RepID=UPI0010F62B77|nr:MULTISPECIES: hypothetical protein [unclassified Campylobacter]NDJ27968.1 hypothetical protein [Campylobacter sp. MIT 19-121]TKX29769.1 hypothetical protein CQA38_03065 [Campylobacter sp. MIT 12-5580]TQR40100.1 hypothetical protein DMB95_08705 [Campylobacter sp. MIT 12-8780]
MKTKTILASLLLSSSLFADSWLQGTVLEVRDAEKSVVIETIYSGPMLVKILPSTRIELDDCGWFGTDNIFEDGTFRDLKVGRYLEIDAYYPNYPGVSNVPNANPTAPNANAVPVATKVEVHCRKAAY